MSHQRHHRVQSIKEEMWIELRAYRFQLCARAKTLGASRPRLLHAKPFIRLHGVNDAGSAEINHGGAKRFALHFVHEVKVPFAILNHLIDRIEKGRSNYPKSYIHKHEQQMNEEKDVPAILRPRQPFARHDNHNSKQRHGNCIDSRAFYRIEERSTEMSDEETEVNRAERDPGDAVNHPKE